MDRDVRIYSLPVEKVNIDTDMALRFLRVRREPDKETMDIFSACLSEFESAVSYRACYRYFDIECVDNKVRFSDEFELVSDDLCKNLSGCKGAFVFVATTSSMVDRLISKYSSLQVSKACIVDAIGSAAIESFCDMLCVYLRDNYKVRLKNRYSPGYGDLSIMTQSKVLKSVDCMRKIGVTLTDNNMMVPTKTVSAIVGVYEGESCVQEHNCDLCEKADCQYRK